MKGKIKLIAILVALFVLFIILRLVGDILYKRQGRLRILSKPNAAVFVDDLMRGKTPFEEILKEGVYKLKLIPDKDDEVATQPASWQKKITIVKNAVTYLDVQLADTDISSAVDMYWLSRPNNILFWKVKSSVIIETEPAGALVYIDNDEKGISPLVLDAVAPGTHELSVFMPGFVRRTKKINVPNAYTLHAFVKLALDPSQIPRYTVETEPTPTPTIQPSELENVVLIKDTPTGWLRVRTDSSLSASESARVKPGEQYTLLQEKEGWYQIQINDNIGWISSEYAQKQKKTTSSR